MIHRNLAPELRKATTQVPAVTLTGPRQSGKTTLCQALFPEHPYRTLEAPNVRAFATEDLTLLESVSQSLAGRTEVLHLLPLTWDEIQRFDNHPATLDDAILTGGYPRIFDRELDPSRWLRSYVATYIERDVRTIANVGDLTTFQRFVELCAGRTAQLLNYSSLAGDCGVHSPRPRRG